jgi:transposase
VLVDVIAPTLTPRRPGARVKTDSRDAVKLVRLYRAGELTSIAVPEESDEAARDVVRTHSQIKQESLRKKHHILKLLTRRGRLYNEGKSWTVKHRKWLKELRWDNRFDEIVFEELMAGLRELEERRQRLELAMQQLAEEKCRAPIVDALRCFQGIDTSAAVALAVEIFDIQRFESPRLLMSYLGLTPGIEQSGQTERRGGITKAGNRFVRFTLGQVAWHYRQPPRHGVRLRRRREGKPPWAIALADRAHRRLHRRYWRLTNRGKPSQKVVTAVARELVGFVWEAMSEVHSRQDAKPTTAK